MTVDTDVHLNGLEAAFVKDFGVGESQISNSVQFLPFKCPGNVSMDAKIFFLVFLVHKCNSSRLNHNCGVKNRDKSFKTLKWRPNHLKHSNFAMNFNTNRYIFELKFENSSSDT